jgi:hypothetical protein
MAWGGLITMASYNKFHNTFLPVEAEITVTKVFITANMKNSKSHGKQEEDVQ